ncbi:copper chaperone PCu(A)C [Chachezhania antarctica]|uniref:copper chaperone PCu(A)C n=1 Tax=Chachezhania antarctica TaxID=2340860 RepID=UPI000EB5D105|nr:copper chaperone PCu(A)C [Chachezhania antarctica]|tara:strand:- start:1552 stop:2325 length:774 start_codon:yes stop_codon:yes gene_type:complete
MIRRLIAVFILGLVVIGLVFYALGPKAGRMVVSVPVAVAHTGHGGMADLYFTLENPGGPDALVSASLPSGGTATIQRPAGIGVTPIPEGASPAFSADGVFLRLTGLAASLDPGTLIPVELHFENSGPVTFKARVGDDGSDHMAHMADAESADSPGPAPTLSMSAKARGESGPWDITLTTGNFAFVRVEDGTPDRSGEGHAHLYLNGLKLGRVYSDTASIGALLPGTYRVTVALNTNTHRPYMADGKPVTAQATITSE